MPVLGRGTPQLAGSVQGHQLRDLTTTLLGQEATTEGPRPWQTHLWQIHPHEVSPWFMIGTTWLWQTHLWQIHLHEVSPWFMIGTTEGPRPWQTHLWQIHPYEVSPWFMMVVLSMTTVNPCSMIQNWHDHDQVLFETYLHSRLVHVVRKMVWETCFINRCFVCSWYLANYTWKCNIFFMFIFILWTIRPYYHGMFCYKGKGSL